ncbi:hypothetical protein [Clostridium tarantellae]|uniref:Uncharacterized protein n=1 Tax=Clostridium tarantellae TaxID=39493 RepID=A0A6I1MNU7_9CLOT|nr:hypothetical protein [Clostridium tarantellae]MPQ44443.1 hypothetical protein [Clostridium tarantellae]
MKNTFKKLKSKLLSTTKLHLEEDFQDENLDLNDICFYDEDGRLKELIERRHNKIINFCNKMLIWDILICMCFLFFYSLTLNFLFIILIKIILIKIFITFIIKPKETWNFIKEVFNA